MEALHRQAPGIRVHTTPLPHGEITDALETGAIHFALGFLPSVSGTERVELLRDRYAVVVRAGHPMAKGSKAADARMTIQDLRRLEYVAVRSHSETFRILQQLGLDGRLVLNSAHFLALLSCSLFFRRQLRHHFRLAAKRIDEHLLPVLRSLLHEVAVGLEVTSYVSGDEGEGEI